jgi:hypothetical protein
MESQHELRIRVDNGNQDAWVELNRILLHKHQLHNGFYLGTPTAKCWSCGEDWPCTVSVLLSAAI